MEISAGIRARCYQILDDPGVLEEEKAEMIEGLVREDHGGILTSGDLERLVLELLWLHRARAPGGGAADDGAFGRAKVIRRHQSPSRWTPPRSTPPMRHASPVPYQSLGNGSTTSLAGMGRPDAGFGFYGSPSDALDDFAGLSIASSSSWSTLASPVPAPATLAAPDDTDDLAAEFMPAIFDDTDAVPSLATSHSSDDAPPPADADAADDEPAPLYDQVRAALQQKALPDARIQAALEQTNYDLAAALRALHVGPAAANKRDTTTIGPIYSQSAPQSSVKLQTVCRYFLSTGQCLRPGCRFSHDLSSTVCRYWLQGSCLAGTTCVFLHHIPDGMLNRLAENGGLPMARRRQYSGPAPGAAALDDDRAFPALAAPKARDPPPRDRRRAARPGPSDDLATLGRIP
ncbi:uncharacterized protein V1510DRAFT_447095, partial [Dipodascopsis tothii]|uniref:uncharacterized protein n=1 Tax=Dipodascopsis tothii TaxID=44089 RepID=UPI0034CE6908